MKFTDYDHAKQSRFAESSGDHAHSPLNQPTGKSHTEYYVVFRDYLAMYALVNNSVDYVYKITCHFGESTYQLISERDTESKECNQNST
jgi:hypothetical protein